MGDIHGPPHNFRSRTAFLLGTQSPACPQWELMAYLGTSLLYLVFCISWWVQVRNLGLISRTGDAKKQIYLPQPQKPPVPLQSLATASFAPRIQLLPPPGIPAALAHALMGPERLRGR